MLLSAEVFARCKEIKKRCWYRVIANLISLKKSYARVTGTPPFNRDVFTLSAFRRANCTGIKETNSPGLRLPERNEHNTIFYMSLYFEQIIFLKPLKYSTFIPTYYATVFFLNSKSLLFLILQRTDLFVDYLNHVSSWPSNYGRLHIAIYVVAFAM